MKTFQQFVREQPADKPICHISWDTCAIGEYFHKVLHKEVPIVFYIEDAREVDIMISEKLLYQLERCRFETYGELAKAIEEEEHAVA